jgi:hypothetical protein
MPGLTAKLSFIDITRSTGIPGLVFSRLRLFIMEKLRKCELRGKRFCTRHIKQTQNGLREKYPSPLLFRKWSE